MEFICHCGSSFYCTFEIFKNKKEKSCGNCNQERGNALKRTKIEDVKHFIVNNSKCTPLFKSYKNNRQPLLILCDCGRRFKKNFHDFKDRFQRQCPNCATLKSKGEKRIEKILSKHNVHFIFQHKIDECRYKRVLPFDFGVFSSSKKDELLFLIEYQGEQHYEVVDFGGRDIKKAKRSFKQQLIKDQVKREYCIENKIELIEIPYWDFTRIEEILIHKEVV